LNLNYGGAETNVAASLANMGIDSTVFTVVPNNSLGKAAIRCLKSNDVHTNSVIYDGDRIGIYFLEEGFGVRASKVTYDRAHSAFSEYDYKKVDMYEILKGYDWLHLSGITPAFSMNCRDMIEQALIMAKSLNIMVSFDCNYRSKLWGWEEARDCISSYLKYVDVLIGIEPLNLVGPDGADLKEGLSMQPTLEEQERIFQAMNEQYHFKAIARHVRYVHSGSENSLKAYFYYDGMTYESKTYRFAILDRVGGGDAFTSGLIYGMIKGMQPTDIVNFAVASSVIKHTLHGDINITDDIQSIYNLMDEKFDVSR
jgi:2-dehydro-3-deoxygluconokinase